MVRGPTFSSVADHLAKEGFLVAQAEHVGRGRAKIPHKNKRRANAVIEALTPEEPAAQEVTADCVCCGLQGQAQDRRVADPDVELSTARPGRRTQP